MKNIQKIILAIVLVLGTFTVRAQQVSAIDKVTASYIGLKDALVGSNATLAKTRSKDLLTDLSVLKGQDAKQQKLVVTYLEKLKYDSRHISETTMIDHQREHFASLSKNMYALLSGLKQNSTTVYQQYCPMKKSYWLSDSEDIRNPYYGDKMPDCGQVTATLKPAAK